MWHSISILLLREKFHIYIYIEREREREREKERERERGIKIYTVHHDLRQKWNKVYSPFSYRPSSWPNDTIALMYFSNMLRKVSKVSSKAKYEKERRKIKNPCIVAETVVFHFYEVWNIEYINGWCSMNIISPIPSSSSFVFLKISRAHITNSYFFWLSKASGLIAVKINK